MNYLSCTSISYWIIWIIIHNSIVTYIYRHKIKQLKNQGGLDQSAIFETIQFVSVYREDQLNQAIDKSASEKHDNLTRHHDLFVEEKGVKKIDELS